MTQPADSFPPLDFEQSPYTGWTRAHWVTMLARMTFGYVRRAELSGSPARVLYPDDQAGHPDAVDALESFSRLAVIWGAWLRNPLNPDHLTFDGHTLDIARLMSQALVEGTNPLASQTYWGDIGHMDQRIVECANLAIAVWLSRERVFAHLSAGEQAQVVNWLAQVDGKGTYPDNWVLFPAISQAVRLRLGYAASGDDLRERLEQMSAFYRGDGWYVDGPGDEYDLYNAWMFGGHYLLWAWIDGDRHPDLCQQILHRAHSFLVGFPYFFGANGVYVPWGRSLGSRFGALCAFALGHALNIAPLELEPGLLRRLSSGCLRYFYEHDLFHPTEHYLRQGFHGHFPPALESYVSPGSPNSAAIGLLALTFDLDSPFWTAVEAPLPVERGDYELVLPTPGFVVVGHQATGQVLLLNSRSGHISDVARHDYTPKYGKLAYSTHFPFNVVPVSASYAPDAMPAVTLDGHTFGHRVLTRGGGAAPGMIWCYFDEHVGGEPQAVWAAVLLWRDVQVVLAILRPTLPVRAFHAPGALGCERSALITRRSDPEAGWEYAEVNERAVGIRRLLGYDEQQASMPFQGCSNINLAYAYAEQPLVYEASASVAVRSLASLALVRPAPFEPTREFDGFKVSAEPNSLFQVGFPDGGQAMVSLALRLTTRWILAGTVFRGDGMRYARLQPEGCGCCGLGVSAVEGVATFEDPATFRLAREPDGVIRLITDSGVALDRTWLGTQPRQAEVRTLTGGWEALKQCGEGVFPTAIVREWQAHTERQLIEFRLRM